MFRTKTVFVLGAGASWHYGYPTGEQLVKGVIEKARFVSPYFEYSMRISNANLPNYLRAKTANGLQLQDAWQAALAECRELETALTQVNPLVIDYFLGWNFHLQAIGTLVCTEY
jgi:hypothetical protein